MQDHSRRVAIVHDWLVGGGAEQVVLALHQIYPDVPIYTSYCTDEWREKLDGKVVTGYLQHWPFSKLRKYIPVLRIWWFTHLKFDDFDLVISSSGNGEAKGIKTPENTLHINYCHSPTHFYWRHYDTYLKNPGFGMFNWLARLGLKILVGPLKKWDFRAAQRADFFIANSTHIQKDIQQFYDRDSVVIHPPVDTERFGEIKETKRNGFVTVGRQTPYKHADLIVSACTQLKLPLTVVGRGPEHENLKHIAGPTVTFDNCADDDAVASYMASADAFIFTAEEDFGIAPVEAMAAGTPVIAYKAGGALDYIVEGKTGLFFDEQTTESLAKVLQNFKPDQFSSSEISQHAQKFSIQNFKQEMSAFIRSKLEV